MTPYDLVFRSFLAKVRDPLYATLEVEVSLRDMTDLLGHAIGQFFYCKVDLSDRDDDLRVFHQELGDQEIQILASIMAVSWLERFLFDSDLLIAPALTTKDFNENSSGTHIRSLDNALDKRKRELESRKRHYSRQDGWSELGGGGI